MKCIIIGKRSNLTLHLNKKIEVLKIFSSDDVLSGITQEYLNKFNGSLNIIFNSFYPLHLMRNLNPNIFLEKSQLVQLKFLEQLEMTLRKNSKIKISKIILSSSSSVKLLDYNNDRNYYASIKKINENLFKNKTQKLNIDLIIARLHNIYGGNDKFSIIYKLINSFKLNSKIEIYKKGKSIRDFIHVEDVVEIYKQILNKKINGTFDVGTGNGYSIENLLKLLGKKNLNFIMIKENKNIQPDISIADKKLLNLLDIKPKYNIVNYFEKTLKIKPKKIYNYSGRDQHEKILLSPPSITNLEKNYVQSALDSNWVAPIGPQINKFENNLSKLMHKNYVAALNSGTSSIHLALKLLKIKPNDFVICQSFTFVGSVFPVIYENAIPIFIDSEKQSWNMDAVLLEKCLKDLHKRKIKPKAIITVDLYGMPANYFLINKIAKKYSIPIIQDAAEALGSKFNNKNCGTNGDLGILSFNGNKIITTSGGGALISNKKKLIEKAKHYAQQSREKKIYYQHKNLGYNYRLSNISASIGNAQIEKLDQFILKRRETFNIYKDYFSKYAFVNFQKEYENKNYKSYSNRWLSTFNFDIKNSIGIRNKIIAEMTKENIEVRPLWKPMHMQPIFNKNKFYNNGISQYLFNSGICLPSGNDINNNNLDLIISILDKILKKI